MRTLCMLSIVAHLVHSTEDVTPDATRIVSVHGVWVAMVFGIALAGGLLEQIRGARPRRGVH